jgi:adenine-specific DNA-methyltransferase
MKYMGSKRIMLQNGFGTAIVAAAAESERVVDLFAGSGVVSWYAAQKLDQPVLAVDLQSYSAVLAGAVISRTRKLNLEKLDSTWLEPTLRSAQRRKHWLPSKRLDTPRTKRDVLAARALCKDADGGSLWSAYGGHYFSPRQALLLDRALALLPAREPDRSACRAALIAAAGYCAAAPGHTAQPFQPTGSAMPYIRDSWRRDPLVYARSWLEAVAVMHARKMGETRVGDALDVATTLGPRDLVIVDPPYSAVQYSRFYHVLESIATPANAVLPVSGAGRYPSIGHRPKSDFSLRTRSRQALSDLLKRLAEASCEALITFPEAESSNGLSGTVVTELAREHFAVTIKTVNGRFSTLGGNNEMRAARHSSAELILKLKPK